MAGVAIHGSTITEVTKEDHVTYRVEEYKKVQDGYCREYHPNYPDICIDYVDPKYDWVNVETRTTGAKINGTVSVASSKFKIQGNNVARIGDTVNFTWVASPAIPSNTSTFRYIATSPTSGSGTGIITGGSNKLKLGSVSIALVGSEVEVLGVTTTIADGNTKINVNS